MKKDGIIRLETAEDYREAENLTRVSGALCPAQLSGQAGLCSGTGFCAGTGRQTHRPCDVCPI